MAPERLPLAGRKVLVVEDEYLIADDLATLLAEAGAAVLGPASSLPAAIRLAGHSEAIDAAVLDINLRGVAVFPLAEQLRDRRIPLLFLTGYGENNIPADFAGFGRCEKPMGTAHVVDHLLAMLGGVAA